MGRWGREGGENEIPERMDKMGQDQGQANRETIS